MADILIDGSADTAVDTTAQRGGPFWTSPLVGYVIYVDSSDNLVYKKTSDGGGTWSAVQTLLSGRVVTFDCWADWQTTSDSGTKIHIVCACATLNQVLYVYFDTSNDSTGNTKIEDAQGDEVTTTLTSKVNLYCSITKTRGGNLATAFRYRDDGIPTYTYMFYTSPDGTTWTSKTSPWEAEADYIVLFPANLADNQDLWGVFWDGSASEISLKTFDNSGNSWSETSIATTIYQVNSYVNMDGAIRHSDGHLLLAAWSGYAGSPDLLTWDITDAGTITAKTNALTASTSSFLVSVFLDQSNNNVYVAYARGTTKESLVAVFYKKSTDGMTNWGSEAAFQADVEDDERWISCGAVITSKGGKFQPVFYNDDLNDLFTNTDNGISIEGYYRSVGGAELSISTVLNRKTKIKVGYT